MRLGNVCRSSFATFAVLFVALSFAPFAHANQIWPTDAGGIDEKRVYQSNEAVYVTGDIDSFGFPARAGICVTQDQAWTDGKAIVDVTAGGCNIITSFLGAGAFIGEIVWLPPLGPGKYDLVIDEDEDGFYNEGIDCVNGEGLGDFAFSVVGTTAPPVINVAQIKMDALGLAQHYRELTGSLATWLTVIAMLSTRLQYAMLLGTSPYALIAGIGVGVVMWIVPMSYNQVVAQVGTAYIRKVGDAMGRMYETLAADPPDPEFQEIVPLDPVEIQSPQGSGAFEASCIALGNRISEQTAIVGALVHAIEKYQGADGAGDKYFTKLQAGAVKEFSNLLVKNLTETQAVLSSLKGQVAAMGSDRSIDADQVRAFQARIASTGMTAEERALVLDAGMTDAEIDASEAYIAGLDLSEMKSGTLMGLLEKIRAATEAAIPKYQDLANQAQKVVDHYTTQEPVQDQHPTARPGGPYAGKEGVPVALDGRGSSDPQGQALTFAWDLDNDGMFDDGAVAQVQHTWPDVFSGYVGLKVTDTTGRSDVAWAAVAIAAGNGAPAITGSSPAECAVRAHPGDSVGFSVTANDPDGDPLKYAWDLDGTVVSTSAAWTYVAGALGVKWMTVTVSDGNPYSNDAVERWQIIIEEASEDVRFLRGDANEDDSLDIGDTIFILSYLFAEGSEPSCLKSADPNDSGGVDIADGIYLLNYIFASGPAPEPPFEACGADPTSDGLTCLSFGPCP